MDDCKNQIIRTLPDNTCCSLAFLSTVFALNAHVNSEKTNAILNLNTDTLNKTIRILTNFYPNIEINTWDNFLLIKGSIYEFLTEINYFDEFNLDYYPNECDRHAILKTFFLVSGRLYYNKDNSLNSKGYSLEFVLREEYFANILLNLLSEFGFELKKTKRQSNYVVYSKNSNLICDLLVKLDAGYAALDMQNDLAMREMRNAANRQNNCFESNLDKTLNASNEQLIAINYIMNNYSIDYLDENLKEVALARLANPDISLNELRIVLNNQLSRAGIKYRLDKIIEIYKKLKGEK